MSDDTTPQGPAGLAALGDMTAEVDRENPGPEQKAAADQAQASAAAAEEGAKAWGMLMYSVGGFVQMIAPELRPIYTEDRCLDWGKHAHSVCKKWGWDSPTLMPEIALAGSTLTFVVPTVLLIRAKVLAAREGGGPVGWMAKVDLWWKARKARKAATAAATAAAKTGREVQTVEAARGGQQ